MQTFAANEKDSKIEWEKLGLSNEMKSIRAFRKCDAVNSGEW